MYKLFPAKLRTLGSVRYSRLVLILLLVLTLFLHSASANIFGDIWNGISGAGKTVGGIIGAPVGWILKGATDPVMDGAADRFKEVADHAADRLDGLLTKENQALQNIASTALKQLDQVMQDNIKRIQDTANDLLN